MKNQTKPTSNVQKIGTGVPPAPTSNKDDTTTTPESNTHTDTQHTTAPAGNGQAAGQGITITLPTAAAAEPKEATSRLSLDIPESLHLAIKMSCLQRRVSIVDDCTALLEQVYRPKAN